MCKSGNNSTIDASGTGTLALTGGMSNTDAGGGTFFLSGTGNGSLAQTMGNGSDGPLNVTKSGTGTWTFFGANPYSGTTTVSAARPRRGCRSRSATAMPTQVRMLVRAVTSPVCMSWVSVSTSLVIRVMITPAFSSV